jgi:hypothetical protein
MIAHYRNASARARILVALGVTSLALIAAAPASAIYRDYEATDEAPTTTRTLEAHNENQDAEKKDCELNMGAWIQVVRHGATITVKTPVPGTKPVKYVESTYRCNDGKWESAFQAPQMEYTYEADGSYVDESDTLQLVNRHEQYTYSTSAGVYAQP